MDNRIIRDFPGTKPDATNNRKTRLPMYIGYAVAMIVSFFLSIATLILILVMVAAMTVRIFRMMHKEK